MASFYRVYFLLLLVGLSHSLEWKEFLLGGDFFTDTGLSDLVSCTLENTNGTQNCKWKNVGGGFPFVDPNNRRSEVLGLKETSKGLLVWGYFFLNKTNPNGNVVQISNIALWSGEVWNDMDGGLPAPPLAIEIGDNGCIYAGGMFEKAGNVSASKIAKWCEGSGWEALGKGIGGNISTTIYGICFFNQSIEEDLVRVNTLVWYNHLLYVGGMFTKAGDLEASHLAIWDSLKKAWLVPSSLFLTNTTHELACCTKQYPPHEYICDNRTIPQVEKLLNVGEQILVAGDFKNASGVLIKDSIALYDPKGQTWKPWDKPGDLVDFFQLQIWKQNIFLVGTYPANIYRKTLNGPWIPLLQEKALNSIYYLLFDPNGNLYFVGQTKPSDPMNGQQIFRYNSEDGKMEKAIFFDSLLAQGYKSDYFIPRTMFATRSY